MRQCNRVYLRLYQNGYELLPVREHPRTMLRTGKHVNLDILNVNVLYVRHRRHLHNTLLFIHGPIDAFIHSLTHLFIHSFTH